MLNINVLKLCSITLAFLTIAVGLHLVGANSLAQATDNYAYYESSYAPADFGIVDLTTGAVFLQIGSLGSNIGYNGNGFNNGLAVYNNTLYSINNSYGNYGQLYSVNTGNGAVYAIGIPSGILYNTFGSTTSGLFAIGYPPGATTLSLYSINPTTGAATQIGGISLPDGMAQIVTISTNSNLLYMAAGGANPYFYQIDTNSGLLSRINTTLCGTASNQCYGMNQMVEENGILFGIDANNKLVTIDPTTGIASQTGVLSLTNIGEVYGLAPFPLPSVSSYYATIAPAGGVKSVDVSATSGDAWTAVSNVPWIMITSGSNGTGNGTVQYSVASNIGGVRAGTIAIAGQTFTVTQGTTLTQAQIGVFRAGAWYVDRDATFEWSGCGLNGCYSYGMAGDQAVTGDWDGTGIVRVGVFRNGNWYLDYPDTGSWIGCGAPADPSKDACLSYGMAGDIPVVGDWSGNGIAKIGVFRNGNWYLDYKGDGEWSGCGTTAYTDRCYTFGMAGDIPVVGDWNGNGISKIGVFRNGMWYLDYNGDGQWGGCGTTADPDRCYTFGMAGDIPVVGDWSGNGAPKIGVFRNGMWYLDYAGTNNWVGCGAPADGSRDVCSGFGMGGDMPLVLR
jgi:hypothetical protein